MKIDHGVVRVMLFFPCIVFYSAVVVYFLKDIDRNNLEAMHEFMGLHIKICFAIGGIGTIIIYTRNWLYDKIKPNKPDNWNMDDNIILRVMNYIFFILSWFDCAGFVWIFASLGMGSKIR
ncbi:hypothetical protein [Stenoxybacter acetivorans]|uniref:hypothetical protein n=1 Tax=Stenoxybacter acetivorans TaxID=422441 RepID=UPI000563DC17|nr:hypothetical protein [Stenoxybacter acetivorans]